MAKKNSKQEKTSRRAAHPRKRINTKKKNSGRYIGRRTEVYAILIIMVAILIIISVFSSRDSGYLNQRINDFLSYIFGVGKYIIPFFLIIWGSSFFLKQIRLLPSRFGLGFFLLFFSLLGTLSNNLKYKDIFDGVLIRTRGGITGAAIFNGLFKLLGSAGAITVLSVLIIISVMVITRLSLINIGKKIGEFFSNVDFRIFAEFFKREKPQAVKDKAAFMRTKTVIPSSNGRKIIEENTASGNIKKRFAGKPELIDDNRRDGIGKQVKREDEPATGGHQLKMPITTEESIEDENYQTPPVNLLKKSINVPEKLKITSLSGTS